MRVQVRFFTFLLIHILFLSNQTSSQTNIQSQTQEIIFEHYSIDEGASASIAKTIFQDKTGYLWFGTYSGLDRYDGVKFKSYKNVPGDTLSITNGFVQCVLEDKKGNLWIGTTNGLDKFDRSSEIFLHFKFNPIFDDINTNNVTAIQEDRNGYFWIGTEGGLIKFNPVIGIFKHYYHDDLNSRSLNHNQIFTIHLDINNDLWIGTNCGLDKFDRETESFIHYWQDPIYKPGFYRSGMVEKYCVTSIYEDNTGIFWIGTNGGLLEFDPYTRKFFLYESDLQNPNTLSFHAVTSVCKESENEIWVGSWVGLNLFNKQTKMFNRFYHNDKIITSLSHSNISAILRERSGTLWITTYGGGINKVNRTNYPFKQYFIHSWRETERFSSASIMQIFEKSDNTLLISMPNGLIKFDPRQEKFKDYRIKRNIRLAREDRYGNIWLALNISSGRGLEKVDKSGRINVITDSSGNRLNFLINKLVEGDDNTMWACTEDGAGLIKIDSRSNKFSIIYNFPSIIYSLLRDQKGLLWFGTREKGLFCFDTQKNKIIEHYQSDPQNPKSISGNSVFAIHEDYEGNFWLGTNIGLNKFYRTKKEFYHFTESIGLAHNWIYLIFQDSKTNLWVSTLKGISKFDIEKQTFKNYDVLQGLVAADRAGVGCQTKNGEIYLDSPGGMTRFHPDSIKDNTYIPPIVITGISVDSKPIHFMDHIELPFSSEQLYFEFAALSFIRPEKNLYAYKLENFDKEWIQAGTRQNTAYTNLKPGEYTFRVKGSNNDGIWNEDGASIKIVILPPWWRTIWAYIFYVLFIAGTIYFTWRMQLKRVRVKHEFEMSKFEAQKLHEVDELKSRFFTNISHEFRTPLTLILGPVKQLIEKSKDEKVKDVLAMVHRNAYKLLELVNELLDIYKLESGNMKLQTVSQNIVPLLKAMVLSFSSYAERKRITLQFNYDEDEIIVYLDKEKFEKIINNILSNAFKFTPPGGKIEVAAKPKPSSSLPLVMGELKGGSVQIIIVDTGIGIPKEKLSKIFDRFYQVDGSHTREQEGTGIGLSLTKELIDLHKGTINVESEEGRGTIVTLNIPLGKEHLQPDEIIEQIDKQESEKHRFSEQITQEEENQTKTKNTFESLQKDSLRLLLIVEDNADVRKYIKDNLDSEFKIIEAKDGEDGWNKSVENIPDLIISDVMMPKMDGFKLCEKLKTDERTSHIPVILLTAKAAKQDKLDGYELGADDYIMKPFETDELKARIKNLIQQRERIHKHFREHGLIELELAKINATDKKFLQSIYELVIKNISEQDFSVDQLAESVNISRSVLQRKVFSLTGENPGELIRRVRINKAAKLIEKRFGNLSEISLEVGFNNPAYFSEVFKKQFGVTPSQYQHKFSNS